MPMILASCTPGEIASLKQVSTIRDRLLSLSPDRGGEIDGPDVGALRLLFDTISHEIVRERNFRSDLQGIVHRIGSAEIRDVASLHEEGKRLVFAHTALRRSPLLLHRSLTLLYEAIARRCANLAGLDRNALWALMAGGPLGRGETTCCSPLGPLVLTTEPRPAAKQILTLLIEAGLDLDTSTVEGGIVTPEGLEGWERTVASLTSSSRDPSPLLADLRPIAGDPRTAREALGIAHAGLIRWRSSGAFPLAARHVGGMRLAIGFFGGFRVERSGPYRGSIDLDREAIEPLVASVRIMAVAAGVTETGTVERIRSLVERGWLQVDPAEQVIDAFHLVCSVRMKSASCDGCRSGDHRYVHPDELSLDEQEGLRNAMETVGSLQRLMIQTVAGRR